MAVFIALTGMSNKTNGSQWAGVVMVFLFQFLMGFGWMACPWLVSCSRAGVPYPALIVLSSTAPRSRR